MGLPAFAGVAPLAVIRIVLKETPMIHLHLARSDVCLLHRAITYQLDAYATLSPSLISKQARLSDLSILESLLRESLTSSATDATMMEHDPSGLAQPLTDEPPCPTPPPTPRTSGPATSSPSSTTSTPLPPRAAAAS